MKRMKNSNIIDVKPVENTNIDMKDRSIFINELESEVEVNKLIAKLVQFDKESDEEVTVFINSPGGSILLGFMIIDTLRAMRSPIRIIVIGMAYSMGLVITVLGSENRYITENASVMYHKLSTWFGGTLDYVEDHTERCKFLQSRIDKGIINNTKITKKMLDSYKRDVYFDAEEAVKLGLVKGIIQPGQGFTSNEKPDVNKLKDVIIEKIDKIIEQVINEVGNE